MDIVETQETARWTVHYSRGGAAEFHSFERGAHLDKPEIWVHRLPRPALVLGSTQPLDMLTATQRSPAVEVAKRRSGGGVVSIDPADDCWIDIFLPAGHQRWSADVGHSFAWVGRAWQRALAAVLASSTLISVATQPQRSYRRPLVCFADTSNGEVVVDGRKVVGLSQRRTRTVARIQSLAITRWDPTPISSMIDPAAASAHGFDGPLTAGDGGGDPVLAGLGSDLAAPSVADLATSAAAELVRAIEIDYI